SVPLFLFYGLTKGAFLATEAASSLGLYLSKSVTFERFGALTSDLALKGLIAGASLMAGAFIAKRFRRAANQDGAAVGGAARVGEAANSTAFSDRAGASRQGVARLLSDCHAAAVEAREGEAVEGFAEGSALVPQHADSHFLAERHGGGRVGTPVDARPIPSETEIHRELVQLSTNRERRAAIGHEPRRVSRIGLYRVGDDAALVEKRLQYGSGDGTNARGTAGIG